MFANLLPRRPRALRWLLPLLLAGTSGCAMFQNLPWIGPWFIPKSRYLTELKSPRFSFEYPRKWGDPVEVKNGLEVRSPDGFAVISITYLEPGNPDYKPPELYRRYMASWGSVEDAHRVEAVFLSTVPAYAVRFTTYQYDAEHLLGSQVHVLYTEARMAPFLNGIVVVRYAADKERFADRSYRKAFDHLLQTLIFLSPSPPEER